jgi:hypothetical protein
MATKEFKITVRLLHQAPKRTHPLPVGHFPASPQCVTCCRFANDRAFADFLRRPTTEGAKSGDTSSSEKGKHQGSVASVLPRQRQRKRNAGALAKLGTSRGDRPFRVSTRRHRGRRFASCSQQRTGYSMSFFRFLCWLADSRTDLFACTQPRQRHIFLFGTRRPLAKHE